MSIIIKMIINLIMILCIVSIIVKMQRDDEKYYALKIIGYYLLGSFKFIFNKISIPLGFIIFILFLRNPKKNLESKRYVAVLGLFAFIVSLIIPKITESYYERRRYIESKITNIYEFDFNSHWKQVEGILELDENSIRSARIEDLNIDYEKDGELKGMFYELTWREEGELRHAKINYHELQKNFSVRAFKIEQWLQYNRLASAEWLFEKLNDVNIKELTPIQDYSYYGFIFGGRNNFGVNDKDIFIIEGDRIVPFTGELPVECYWIKTFGMKKIRETHYGSAGGQYYLFDLYE